MRQVRKVLLVGMVALCLAASCLHGAITFTTLISFNGTNGANPLAGLLLGKDGNFYGTAAYGGAYSNGAIFEISADGTFFTNMYNFAGGTNGAGPVGALVSDADGNLYGTTVAGGMSNSGTIFRLSANGDFTQLGAFSGTNGSYPDTALLQAPDGSFYGATKYGGPYPNTTQGGTGYGVIFRITTNGDLSTPVIFDNTNGANASVLVLGQDGNFYGTAAWGGNTSLLKLGFGTIFRLSLDGTFTNLYKFTGFNDGAFPYATLVQGNDGDFYGSTTAGGSSQIGTVFRITPGGLFTNLYTFPYSEMGSYPYAAMIQGSDGNFYGTTYIGGSNQLGSVFQMTPDGKLTRLLSFTGGSGSYPGANPESPLVQGPDGNFYGTTVNGGTYNDGTVFRLSLPLPPVFESVAKTNGTVTLVWSSVATQTYELQYTTNLAQPSWTVVVSGVVATNGTMTVSNFVGSDPQRFYRVVLSDLVSR